MHFADTSSGRPFSKDPAVVHFQGKYWMYYTLPPRVDDREYSIGIATSEDLENWQVVGKINPAAGYEKNGLCAPGALIHEGKIHLFYQTYGNWVFATSCSYSCSLIDGSSSWLHSSSPRVVSIVAIRS